MSEDRFALAEPEVPWSAEEWERASRYAFTVWWDATDDLYLARCVEIPEAMSHGSSPAEAITNAIDAVAVFLDAFGETIQPFEAWDGRLADLLYTTDQVAAILGVNVQRVNALAKSRDTGTKRGRDLLFTARDIEKMRERRPGRPPRVTA